MPCLFVRVFIGLRIVPYVPYFLICMVFLFFMKDAYINFLSLTELSFLYMTSMESLFLFQKYDVMDLFRFRNFDCVMFSWS